MGTPLKKIQKSAYHVFVISGFIYAVVSAVSGAASCTV